MVIDERSADRGPLSAARRLRGLALAVAGASLFAASPSLASPLLELVGDVTGPGGLNPRVAAVSSAAAYFNPALLARAPQQIDVGFVFLTDQISMSLDGRPGGDVPLIVGDRSALDPGTRSPISNDTMPTDWLEHGCSGQACGDSPMQSRPRQAAGTSDNRRAFLALGMVAPIVGDSFVFGLHTLLPMGDFMTTHSFYADEREQFFTNSLHAELYSDRLTAMSVALGFGSKVSKSIAFGAGFTMGFQNEAVSGSYARDPIDYEKMRLSNDVRVKTALAPNFGAEFRPSERLSIVATLHTAQRMEIATQFNALVPSGVEAGASRLAVHNYVPVTLGLGSEWAVVQSEERRIALVGTVTYEAWSNYVDRQGEVPKDSYGLAYEWKDILVVDAGLRYGAEDVHVLLDATYRPSPVPEQTGRSNYVDNSRVGCALGVDFDMKFDEVTIRPAAQLQGQRLLYRHHQKDNAQLRDELPDGSVDLNGNPLVESQGLQTNNPGWPGFASEGWILAGSLSVAIVY